MILWNALVLFTFGCVYPYIRYLWNGVSAVVGTGIDGEYKTGAHRTALTSLVWDVSSEQKIKSTLRSVVFRVCAWMSTNILYLNSNWIHVDNDLMFLWKVRKKLTTFLLNLLAMYKRPNIGGVVDRSCLK